MTLSYVPSFYCGGGGYVLAFAGHNIPGLYQSRPAGRPSRRGMALHVPAVRRTGVLCRSGLHDHRRRHRHIQPHERPPHPPPGRGPCHGLQRADDGRRALRLLRQPLLLGPVLLGSALRHRRRLRGRGAEQLCRPPLQEPPHELAALLLGRRRLRRALHNGLRAQRRPGLAHGLPVHSLPADRPHAGAVFESAAVEEDVRRPGCGPRPRAPRH